MILVEKLDVPVSSGLNPNSELIRSMGTAHACLFDLVFVQANRFIG
jgi:hypothetical protein